MKNGRNGDNGTQRGPPILPSRSFSNQPKTPWRASKSMRTRRGVSLCSLAPPRTDLNLAWNQPKYARRRRPPRGPPRHARDPLRIVANRAKHRREDSHFAFLSSSLALSLSSSSSSRLELPRVDRIGGKGTSAGIGGREIGLKNFHAGGAPITKLLSRCRVLLLVQRKITVSLNYKLRRPLFARSPRLGRRERKETISFGLIGWRAARGRLTRGGVFIFVQFHVPRFASVESPASNSWIVLSIVLKIRYWRVVDGGGE